MFEEGKPEEPETGIDSVTEKVETFVDSERVDVWCRNVTNDIF